MLMYEIWSLGHRPFEGITNPEVILISFLTSVHVEISFVHT